MQMYYSRNCQKRRPPVQSFHFTEKTLAEFYDAEECTFDTDGGIYLHFRSWEDVVADEDGRVLKVKRVKIPS